MPQTARLQPKTTPRSSGKFSAAFVAAALQNRAAGLIRHALHETMLAGAMTLFRLIGTLRHMKSFGFSS
jgi:hypothetical protein